MKQEIDELIEFIMSVPACNLVVKRVSEEEMELVLADDMALDAVQGPNMIIKPQCKPEYVYKDAYGNQVGSYWGRIRIITVEQFRVLCRVFDTYQVDRVYLPEAITDFEREEYLASEFVYVHPYLYASLKEDLFVCAKRAKYQLSAIEQLSATLSIPDDLLYLYKGQEKAYEMFLTKSGYMEEYQQYAEKMDEETVKEEYEEVKDDLVDQLKKMGILQIELSA